MEFAERSEAASPLGRVNPIRNKNSNGASSRFLKFTQTAGLVAVFAVAGLFLFSSSAQAIYPVAGRKRFSLAGLLFISLFFIAGFSFASPAFGATFYVDVNNGSDLRNGTQAQDINTPVKSLARIFVNGWSSWGDTIKLKSGTYTGGDDTGGIWVTGAGRWIVLSSQVQGSVNDGPLTITVTPGADVTIDMPTQFLYSYMILMYGDLIIAGESATNKLKITNTQNSPGSFFQFTDNTGEHSITFQDVTIDWNNANHQLGWVSNSVTSYDQNITFRRCEIKNTGTDLTTEAIVRMQPAASIFTNLIFESCLLHDVGYLFHDGNGEVNVTMTNNTISGVKVARSWDGTQTSLNTYNIKNNIFNGNSTHTELLYAYPQTYAQIQSNWTVENNILYVPTTADPGNEIEKIGSASSHPFPLSENNYYMDPLFTSASDFTLQTGSYASGRGDNSAVPSSGGDINGNAYNGSDVGCYSNPVAAQFPTITDDTASFVGDSIAKGIGNRAVVNSWLSSSLSIVGAGDLGAAIGGSRGQATKFYVDRAALTWGPKYIFFVPYHNNYPESGNTPSNITYAQVANDMEVAMKKAEYWGITPIFVGMSGVMGADPTTKPSSVNSAVAEKCATNTWSCGSFVDYMTTINSSNWNLEVASGGYYQAGGLAANVHPTSDGYDVALDEAEYLFYSKSTMGSAGINVGAGARIYGDGKFRNIGTASGSTADLTITPQSGNFTAYNYSSWMDIANLTWENTGTRHKVWTETSTTAGTNILHTVGDLEANTYYNVKVDDVIGQDIVGANCTAGVCLSNAQGEINFTYTGTYSDHTFDVEEKDVTAPTGFSLSLGITTISSIIASIADAIDDISGLHATTPYYFDRNSAAAVSDWQAGTTWTDSSLTSNTQYTYKVKARDAATSPNVSDFTATQSKYTLAPTPTNLAADTVGQTSITLTVDAINNPTAASSGYYFANTTNSTNSGWIQTNTWQNTNLTCGTAYSYTVKYRNGDGTETDTIALTQATANCPAAAVEEDEEEAEEVEDLDISDIEYESTETTITIKWKTNNKADSQVEYGTAIDMDQDKEDDDNEKIHKIVLKNLDSDTLYYFKIKSEDENGSEDSSDRKSIRTEKQDAVSSFVNNLFSPIDSKEENKEEASENKSEEKDIIDQVNEIPEKIQEKLAETKFFNADVSQKNAKKYLSEVKFQLVDKLGSPIANTLVTLHSDPQTTTTNEQGYATFKDVETGKHNLTFNYQNDNRRFAVNIQEPKTTDGEVRMETVVIQIGEKPSTWIYYLAGVLGIAIIVLIFKRKKKISAE